MSGVKRDSVWIPTRGFSIPIVLGLAASTILVVGGGLLLYFFESSPGGGVSIQQLFALIALILVIACAIPLFSILRRPFGVEFTDAGLRITYPFRTVSLSWSDLMRVRSVTQGVVVIRKISDLRNEFGGAFWISVEQARAILKDARCPPVEMSDHWRAQILSHHESSNRRS